MERIVQATVKKHRLLEDCRHVVVGISGGADSVALTHVLKRLLPRLGCRITLAHLHHGLRGAAADADTRFVERLAERLELPLRVGRRDVRRLARTAGVSIEMAAREARYRFFAATVRAVGADRLATAHTADDQAETLLLRILRGTGLQGLGGIRYQVRLEGISVIRPMLDVTHREAVSYLERRRLRWCEDASNNDTRMLRNRIRRELLPLLEARANPALREGLIRLAELVREEDAWLEQEAARRLGACGDTDDALSSSALRQEAPAMQRRMLRIWLSRHGLHLDEIPFRTIERLLALAASARGTRRVHLPRGREILRRYDRLTVAKRGDAGAAPDAYRIRLRVPGETVINEAGVRVRATLREGRVPRARGNVGVLPAEVFVSRARLGRAKLYVRAFRPGDRVRPLGMTGSKKIQDLFVDGKVPREWRAKCPLLECKGEIVWVPGYTVARGWELPGAAGRAVCVRVERR